MECPPIYNPGMCYPEDDCIKCWEGYIKEQQIDNGDLVRSMNNEEISKWFWWMLNKTREYTDSRIALKEWLNEEANLNDLPFK